jgi:hypothetical protein
MAALNYSDDEIRRMRGQIQQQSVPALKPSIPKPGSTTGVAVSRELSLDEILIKIQRGIAGSL